MSFLAEIIKQRLYGAQREYAMGHLRSNVVHRARRSSVIVPNRAVQTRLASTNANCCINPCKTNCHLGQSPIVSAIFNKLITIILLQQFFDI